VIHSTALNSSDNLDNHQSSADIYWRGEAIQ